MRKDHALDASASSPSPAERPIRNFQYDAFISYASKPDYATARRVEAFLESFHQNASPGGARIRQLEICRDGSDFTLPARRPHAEPGADPVWEIIVSELRKCEYLIVLCSTGAVASPYVEKEVAWFIQHRGPAWVLPVVTEGDEPMQTPEEIFPRAITATGVHRSSIWYDLRGQRRRLRGDRVRDPEDELVRLAADLLRWDQEKNGSLWSLWERERLRRARRRARLLAATAVVIIAVGLVAVWQGVSATRSSAQARSNAIAMMADAADDPLASALLLIDLADAGAPEPADALRILRRLAAGVLPLAELRGHTDGLTSVAVHPGGSHVLTASDDGSARVWRTDGRGVPRILRGHRGGVHRAVFSSDGSLIATASADSTARIWGGAGEDPLFTLPHRADVVSVQFTGNHRNLVTVTREGTASIWNLADGSARTLALPGDRSVAAAWSDSAAVVGLLAASDGSLWSFGPSSRVRQLASVPADESEPGSSGAGMASFSRDGSTAAVALGRRVVVLQGAGPPRRVALPHPAAVTWIDLAADGSRIATASRDGLVRVWERGRLLRELDPGVRYLPGGTAAPGQPSPRSARLVRIDDQGRRLAAYHDDGVIRVWDLTGPGAAVELRGHAGVQALSFSRDGALVVSAADDGTARVWPLARPAEPLVLRHPAPLYAAALSPNRARLATGDREGTVRVWELHRAAVPLELRTEPESAVKELMFGPDATHVHAGLEDGRVVTWAENDSGPPHLLPDAIEPLADAAGILFVTDQGRAVTWSDDGWLRVQSLDDRSSVVIRVDTVAPLRVAVDPAGERLATAHSDGAIRVWRGDGAGRPVLLAGRSGHSAGVLDVDFSPDGSRILSVSKDGTARVWSADGRREPIQLRGPEPGRDWLEQGAFSPDGKSVAVTSSSGRLWGFRANGEAGPTVFRRIDDLAHIGPVTVLSYSRDGQWIVTAGGVDGDACIWPSDNSGRPTVMDGDPPAITVAELATDNSWLLTASEDGTARVWRTRWRDLISHLRARTTATLTVQQRVIFLGADIETARKEFARDEARFQRDAALSDQEFSYPTW